MSSKRTYIISSFNFKSGMNELFPIVFTSKKKAIDYAEKTIAFGAKDVKVISVQTKEVVYPQHQELNGKEVYRKME